MIFVPLLLSLFFLWSFQSGLVNGIPFDVYSPMFIVPLRDGLFSEVSLGARNPIRYAMGASVLTGDVSIMTIYYGNWSTSRMSMVDSFFNGLGLTPWMKITHKYYFQQNETSPRVFAKGTIRTVKSVTDFYSRGKNLSGTDIPDIISDLIAQKRLPETPNGVYFFLTSGDVIESMRPDVAKGYAFCEAYCGYHLSWKLPSGVRIAYAMAGIPSACLAACAPRSNVNASPNGDVELDSLLSIIAHELTEAITDPESEGNRAWADVYGFENADKCAWTFGNTNVTDTYTYNMEFGGRRYMVQQNWDPEKQECAMSA